MVLAHVAAADFIERVADTLTVAMVDQVKIVLYGSNVGHLNPVAHLVAVVLLVGRQHCLCIDVPYTKTHGAKNEFVLHIAFLHFCKLGKFVLQLLTLVALKKEQPRQGHNDSQKHYPQSIVQKLYLKEYVKKKVDHRLQKYKIYFKLKKVFHLFILSFHKLNVILHLETHFYFNGTTI
jgi:hypothetical protein